MGVDFSLYRISFQSYMQCADTFISLPYLLINVAVCPDSATDCVRPPRRSFDIARSQSLDLIGVIADLAGGYRNEVELAFTLVA